jgi:MFS family permease
MYTGIVRRAWSRLAWFVFGCGATTVEERNYRNLLLSGFWFGPVDGGIFNYLPVFLARLGAPASLISLLASGPAFLGILAYVPGGAYAERHRDLVSLFVRMALIARISYPLIALTPLVLPAAHAPLAIILIWSLAAIPNAIHVPAWTAFMQKAVPPQQRAQLNGARWALLSLTSALCIAVFGYMLDRATFPVGYQIVFLISFVAGVLNLQYFARVQVPPFESANGPTYPANASFKSPAQDNGASGSERLQRAANPGPAARIAAYLRPFTESRAFVRYNIASLIYRLTLAMPAGLFSIFWVQDLHATDTWIGLRGTAGYATLVVGYVFWGRMTSRIGHRTLLLVCAGSLALYPILTALAPSMSWLLPAAAVWGFTVAGVDIGLFDMLLATCPEGRQPTFAAAAQMFVSVAMTVGPMLGAALAGMTGTRSALLIIGGLQLLGAASFVLLPSREQERIGAGLA